MWLKPKYFSYKLLSVSVLYVKSLQLTMCGIYLFTKLIILFNYLITKLDNEYGNILILYNTILYL